MIARTPSALALLGLAAGCGGRPAREVVPDTIMAPPPGDVVDRGELVLRSGGEDIGHEKFTMERRGPWLHVELTASTTFPAPTDIELQMEVDPATWELDRYDLRIERGGRACTGRWRNLGAEVEVAIEEADGTRRVLGREPREHARYNLGLRPTLTQSAVCAVADDQPRELESFSPWFIVRTAPRQPSTIAATGGGVLDLVRVDDSIDVYCEGGKLAIVHYAEHAFVAARTEYDAAARALTAPDPVDDLWASELACPPPE